MVKVGPGKGRDGRIRVYFQGSLLFLNDLAKEQCVSTQLALSKWRREGEPGTVGTEFFEQARAARRDPDRAKYYTVDGQPYTAKQMATEFGVVQSTLDNHRIRKGKTAYTSNELREWRRRIEEKNAAVRASSKWARGPSEPPPFGSELTAEQRAALRLMAAW